MNDIVSQVQAAIQYLREAPDFIKKHKLWQGYWEIGWMAKASIIAGIILSTIFILDIKHGLQELFSGPETGVYSMSFIVETFDFSGGLKYGLLIILEMLIFHFSARTLAILENKEYKPEPQEFIDAQIRMIKVSLRSYFFEIILTILISMTLSLWGGEFLKTFLVLLVQFYFIGFAFMDNYFEQKDLKITESAKYIRNQVFAATVIGAAGYALFMIPLLGALVAPFICSVAATTYLHYRSGKDTEMEEIETPDFIVS